MCSQIRTMTSTDTDRVGEILYEAFTEVATKFGYDPVMNTAQEGKSWAWAMFHHGAGQGLVAEVENRVVGTVFFNKRGTLSGAGPMAVDRDFQGKKIAQSLMDALIEGCEESSSLRCVQEAFNTTSFTFQHAFNFVPVADLLDLTFNGKAKASLVTHPHVSNLTANEFDELCTYDNQRSEVDRRVDFAYYARWGKILVYREHDQIRGYLACLPGSKFVQLGPLIAEGEDEAEYLFRHALAIFKDRPCRTRVMARDYQLGRAMMKLGFRLYCLSLLMVRGTWRPGRYVEAFGRFPEGV